MKATPIILGSVCRSILWGALISGGAFSGYAQITICCNSNGMYTNAGTTASCPVGNYGSMPYTVSDGGSFNVPMLNPNGTVQTLTIGAGAGAQASATGFCNGIWRCRMIPRTLTS